MIHTCQGFKRTSGVEWIFTCLFSTSAVAPPPPRSDSTTDLISFTPTFPLLLLFSVPSARAKNIVFNPFVIFSYYGQRFNQNASGVGRASYAIRSFFNGSSSEIAQRKQDFICPFEAPPPQSFEAPEFTPNNGGAGSEKRRTIQLPQLFGCTQRFRGVRGSYQGGNK